MNIGHRLDRGSGLRRCVYKQTMFNVNGMHDRTFLKPKGNFKGVLRSTTVFTTPMWGWLLHVSIICLHVCFCEERLEKDEENNACVFL